MKNDRKSPVLRRLIIKDIVVGDYEVDDGRKEPEKVSGDADSQ